VALLRVDAELAHLAQVRQFVETAALALGAPADIADALVLAVDECATNVIEHGYGGRGGQLEVEIRRDGRAVDAVLIVVLRDNAPLFDPTQLPQPDVSRPLEERPVGGLGAFLVRQLVDRVDYRVTARGGNELTLVKRLAGAAPAQGEGS